MSDSANTFTSLQPILKDVYAKKKKYGTKYKFEKLKKLMGTK